MQNYIQASFVEDCFSGIIVKRTFYDAGNPHIGML